MRKVCPYHFGCQHDEPLASLVTTNRVINVYGFLVDILLPLYAVLLCLYYVGNKLLLMPLLLQLLYLDAAMECVCAVAQMSRPCFFYPVIAGKHKERCGKKNMRHSENYLSQSPEFNWNFLLGISDVYFIFRYLISMEPDSVKYDKVRRGWNAWCGKSIWSHVQNDAIVSQYNIT